MKTKQIFIAHPQTTEQTSALKAFMEALKIKFEIAKNDKYNPEFVAKIEASKKQAKNGQVSRVKKEDLKDLLGF